MWEYLRLFRNVGKFDQIWRQLSTGWRYGHSQHFFNICGDECFVVCPQCGLKCLRVPLSPRPGPAQPKKKRNQFLTGMNSHVWNKLVFFFAKSPVFGQSRPQTEQLKGFSCRRAPSRRFTSHPGGFFRIRIIYARNMRGLRDFIIPAFFGAKKGHINLCVKLTNVAFTSHAGKTFAPNNHKQKNKNKEHFSGRTGPVFRGHVQQGTGLPASLTRRQRTKSIPASKGILIFFLRTCWWNN